MASLIFGREHILLHRAMVSLFSNLKLMSNSNQVLKNNVALRFFILNFCWLPTDRDKIHLQAYL